MRKQIAIRLDEDYLVELKVYLAKRNIKLQEYIETLIRKDMEENGHE